MTPDQRVLVQSLLRIPGRGEPLSRDDFLQRMGVDDGPALGRQLLTDARVREHGLDLELSLVVLGLFGVPRDCCEVLQRLALADWHTAHEVIVDMLGEHCVGAISTFEKVAEWVPSYRDYDGARSLRDKAVRAIGATPGLEAEESLRRLLVSNAEPVRVQARKELERRSGEE